MTFYQNDNRLLVSMTECSAVVVWFSRLWRFHSPEQIKEEQKLLRHSLHILLRQQFAEVQSIQLADTGQDNVDPVVLWIKHENHELLQ